MYRDIRNKLFSCALSSSLVLAVSCGREDEHDYRSDPDYNPALDEFSPQNAKEFDFIAFGGGIYGLVAVSKKETITICLSGVSSANLQKWDDWISDSVLKWLKPLRGFTSDAIASKVDVVTTNTGCDASFRVVNGAWGYTNIGNTPSITVGPNVPFGVVIHEFGHAFGLSDTYQNGTSGNCQAGQPQSLMCNISFSDLQQDDINGMKQVFKSKFPNDVPGPTPTPGTDLVDADIRVAVTKVVNSRGNYDLYLSASAEKTLGNGTMSYCVGSDADCSTSASYRKAALVGSLTGGLTQIYKSPAVLKLDNPQRIHVHFVSEKGQGDETFKVQKR